MTDIVRDIDTKPSEAYFNSHYFCDYIELLAVVNNSDILSISDILNRFIEDNDAIGTEENNEDRDKWETRMQEWFSILSARQSAFKSFYPFIINNTTIELKDSITNKKKAYIFLLLSSVQKYIHHRSILTSDFEELSVVVLKKYLHSEKNIHRFGKSMADYNKYKGHITQKIDLLAKDLKCDTQYKSHYFADNNSGDGGLDVVAWTIFSGDTNQNNIQIFFGQCATGKDWLKKQNDTKKFEDRYIHFTSDINYSMFIPYDGRNANRELNEEAKMGKYLLFDRVRILYLLESNVNEVVELSSFDRVVDKVINYKEGIV